MLNTAPKEEDGFEDLDLLSDETVIVRLCGLLECITMPQPTCTFTRSPTWWHTMATVFAWFPHVHAAKP